MPTWKSIRADLEATSACTGAFRPQPPADWTGPFPLPRGLIELYAQLGPDRIEVETGAFAALEIPSLTKLWQAQVGYRLHGITLAPNDEWPDDWLVLGRLDGDAVVVSRSTGAVLHAPHGWGHWEGTEVAKDVRGLFAVLIGIAQAAEAYANRENPEDEPDWLSFVTASVGDASTASAALVALGLLEEPSPS